jgi:hypothetical protein
MPIHVVVLPLPGPANTEQSVSWFWLIISIWCASYSGGVHKPLSTSSSFQKQLSSAIARTGVGVHNMRTTANDMALTLHYKNTIFICRQ